MRRRLDQRTVDDISRRLAELLAVPVSRATSVKREPFLPADTYNWVDLLVSAGSLEVCRGMESRSLCRPGGDGGARAGVRGQVPRKLIPIRSPHPTWARSGSGLLAENGRWPAGPPRNASLSRRQLRVTIEGKPNQFKRAGRPLQRLLRRKVRGIARWLLIEPNRAFSQRELAKAAGLDEGFTSRIVRHLEDQRPYRPRRQRRGQGR